MTTLVRFALATFLLASLLPSAGHSAQFELRDGQKLEGDIIHYFRGIFTVRTREGEEKYIGQNEVEGIAFGPAPTSAKQMPMPSAPEKNATATSKNFLQGISSSDSKYSTPLRTFEIWLQSATKGDLDGMIDCYASFRKKEVKKELRDYSKEMREKMQSTTAETKFIPGKPFYQGDQATLEINWQKGVQGDSQVLQFVLEDEGWKIIR